MKNKSSTDKASRGRRTDSAVKKTGEDEQVSAHALVKLPPAQSNQVAARRRITSGATTERREKLSTKPPIAAAHRTNTHGNQQISGLIRLKLTQSKTYNSDLAKTEKEKYEQHKQETRTASP
jgi:hypothetical protein